MKTRQIVILFALASAAVCAPAQETPAQETPAQETPALPTPLWNARKASVAAELSLTQELLNYISKKNDPTRGGVKGTFPESISIRLTQKKEILTVLQKALEVNPPDLRPVLVKLAESKVAIVTGQLRAEQSKPAEVQDGDKLALLKLALASAAARLTEAKAVTDENSRQNWLIGETALDVLDLRLDIELIR